MNIRELDKKYREKVKEASELSRKIERHLHSVFDDKIQNYKTFDDFLFDINEYAGDSLGKLIYIKIAKDKFSQNKKE